jgi:hypothetical protein
METLLKQGIDQQRNLSPRYLGGSNQMPGGDDEQPGISMEFCEKAVRQILEGWVCEPPGKTKTDAPDANRHRGVTFAGTTNRKRACRKNL